MGHQTISRAWAIVRRGIAVLKNDPHILIYPYLAIIFILLTSPVVGHFVINTWNRLDHPELVTDVTRVTPHQLLAHLGLVTFSVFYTIFVTSFFTCMIAASALTELESKQPSSFYGLKVVLRRFMRVLNFAVLAIFFFPMGIIAQRQKLKSLKGIFEAVSSSFSLSMSQMAPAIVAGNQSVFGTVRHSVNTLGQLWKESILIRIGLFGVTLVLGTISLIPKLIEHHWIDSDSSRIIGWIITALLGASGYVLVRVVGTIFTTTLYFQAKKNK